MRDSLVVLGVLLAFAGCKKKEGDAAKAGEPAGSGSAAAAPAPEGSAAPPAKTEPKPADSPAVTEQPVKTCAEYGGTGKGEFGDKCVLKGNAPFTVKLTGQWKAEGSDSVPEYQVTNGFPHAVSWASVSWWVYDKAGKLMEFDGSKRGYQNGSGLLELKAGETKTYAYGPDKKTVPEGGSVVVEVTGWGWDEEPKMYFRSHGEIEDVDERPKDGWK